MRFLITLSAVSGSAIPINYQYPLSAAIYKIISKGNMAYGEFLHEHGYGRGFKFFTFSDLRGKFSLEEDRLILQEQDLRLTVCFHLPDAAQHFIKGLFQSELVDIADRRSKVRFQVRSIEALPDMLIGRKEQEIISIDLKPLSAVVAGLKNEKGYYNYLSPQDSAFADSLIYNWREKIRANYDDGTADQALLMIRVFPLDEPFKSRLITIKADTDAQTRVRGWRHFGLNVTAEKRFLSILLNCGAGLYNAQGCGCVGVGFSKER